MPEGHTIFLLAADHDAAFAGQRVRVSSPQGRFAKGAAAVDGSILKRVWARGKHLFYDFGKSHIVHIHLGLHGWFELEDLSGGKPAEPGSSVRMRIVGDRQVLDLIGPIVCEVIDPAGVAAIADRLGPDVLDPKAEPSAAWAKIAQRAMPIGALLMDQSILCGIGNAYRSEILYRQRLHPLTPGKALTRKTFDALWADAAHVLKMGIANRMAWAVDETNGKKPKAGEEPDRYNVYKRQRCRNCGAKIEMILIGGRKCFFCPKEQKLPAAVKRRSVKAGAKTKRKAALARKG